MKTEDLKAIGLPRQACTVSVYLCAALWIAMNKLVV